MKHRKLTAIVLALCLLVTLLPIGARAAETLAITKQPRSTTAGVREDVWFQVRAVGEGLTYQWQSWNASTGQWENMNGFTVQSQDMCTTPFETGKTILRCVVTDENGNSVISDEVILTVVPNTTISSQPYVDSSLMPGKTIELTVLATGDDLRYRWQYRTSGESIWMDADVEGADANTITLQTNSEESGYSYRCIVSNGYGSFAICIPEEVEVAGGFAMETSPGDWFVEVGEVATMNAGTSYTSGVTYQWQESMDGGASWSNVEAEGADTDSLQITVTEAHHGRKYRCVATNRKGVTLISEEGAIILSSVISLFNHPSDVVIRAGREAQFQVLASGNGVTYQWQYRNGTEDSWKNLTLSSSQDSILYVEATPERDGQQYRCVTTEADGYVTITEEATLTVISPQVITHPDDVVIAEGESFTFNVEALGEELTYQWQHRDTAIDEWVDLNNKTTSITAMATEDMNGSQYRCVVTDANGVTASSYEATIKIDGMSQPVVAEGECGDGVYWELDENGLLRIYGRGKLDGHLGGWNYYDQYIKKVVVEEGVFGGLHGFFYCANLTSVMIEGSITELDGGAFGYCNALNEIRFCGDAPIFADNCFLGDTLTVYYPLGNETWTEEIMQDYGGTITWIGYVAGEENYVPMYRVYNPNSGEHFYTANAAERDFLAGLGWKYEGVAWNAPLTGDPVYRVYNPNSGDHHYTMSAEERDFLASLGWVYEGIGWYSAAETGVPMYRIWNPNADCGSHHYTTSVEERDWLDSLGWKYEGIGWYGINEN